VNTIHCKLRFRRLPKRKKLVGCLLLKLLCALIILYTRLTVVILCFFGIAIIIFYMNAKYVSCGACTRCNTKSTKSRDPQSDVIKPGIANRVKQPRQPTIKISIFLTCSKGIIKDNKLYHCEYPHGCIGCCEATQPLCILFYRGKKSQ